MGRIRPTLDNLCRFLSALSFDLSDLQRELDQPSGQPLAPSGWALVSPETAEGFAEQLRAQAKEVYVWQEGGKVKVVWKERRQTAA